jgi:hypothetical protein
MSAAKPAATTYPPSGTVADREGWTLSRSGTRQICGVVGSYVVTRAPDIFDGVRVYVYPLNSIVRAGAAASPYTVAPPACAGSRQPDVKSSGISAPPSFIAD